MTSQSPGSGFRGCVCVMRKHARVRARCCCCVLGVLGACGLALISSGGTGKTNVGGPSSSFGIWHEQWEECAALAEEYGITVKRIHTHIGSGSDP